MKIRKIQLENHPILNNLDLDFTDKNGNTVNTIIIAGENGVGKSLLLNTIHEFSLHTLSTIARNEKWLFEIQLSDEEISFLKEIPGHKQYLSQAITKNIIQIELNFNLVNTWDQVKIRGLNHDKFSIILHGSLFNDKATTPTLNTIFSDAEISFTSNEISTVTSTNVDIQGKRSEKSTPNLATQITQLLIDVQSIDALELSQWARQNPGNPVPNEILDKRTKRFASAFQFMFPTKKFISIETIAGKKKVMFEEFGKQMSINQLSSGEKQVVFRGSFVLKDKESAKGTLILIDEPEISMHPKWQLNILGFFKKLFTNDDGVQTSQIIVSTHSPFILHNAKRSNDKVIILKKNEKGEISVSKEPQFYSWSPETIVQEAFDISNFFHDENVNIFLEGKPMSDISPSH